MSLQLHNTLTRATEPFVPLHQGRVSMYTCGPTVWNYAHIGNFRTFLFEDLLRRWLEASGYQVFHVMNLTDVDDRIIKEAGARGIPIRDFTTPFAQAFFEDRDYLRIRPAHEYPRATDYIAPMVDLVATLLANGTAYRGEDGSVYFGIDRFPAYGRLSQLDKRSLKTGASGRVSSDEYDKENAQDFALWKAAKPEDEAGAGRLGRPLRPRLRPAGTSSARHGPVAPGAPGGLGQVLEHPCSQAWTSSSRTTRTRSPRAAPRRGATTSRGSGCMASS
ncbi:MAG: hypothetical protein IPK12_20395 [Gemmatimonadetes bacterium]|nr:hypothetical protein [Gemmatimonadota bacterium]